MCVGLFLGFNTGTQRPTPHSRLSNTTPPNDPAFEALKYRTDACIKREMSPSSHLQGQAQHRTNAGADGAEALRPLSKGWWGLATLLFLITTTTSAASTTLATARASPCPPGVDGYVAWHCFALRTNNIIYFFEIFSPPANQLRLPPSWPLFQNGAELQWVGLR